MRKKYQVKFISDQNFLNGSTGSVTRDFKLDTRPFWLDIDEDFFGVSFLAHQLDEEKLYQKTRNTINELLEMFCLRKHKQVKRLDRWASLATTLRSRDAFCLSGAAGRPDVG